MHSWKFVEVEALETLCTIGLPIGEISTRLDISVFDCNAKIKELGLGEKKADPPPAPIKPVRKHHPPVYTNSKSPYGISDELHSTPDRILI